MRTRLVALFVLLHVAATVWPGAALANRVHPRVLGLPFNFAWYALWIVLAFFALVWLDAGRRPEE